MFGVANPLGRFEAHQPLPTYGRVHRHPAMLLQEHLGAAVLRALQLGGLPPSSR